MMRIETPELLPWGQVWHQEFWDAKHRCPPCCNPHQGCTSHFSRSPTLFLKENLKLGLDFATMRYHREDKELLLSLQPSQDLSHPPPLLYCSMRNRERIPTTGRDAATQHLPGPVSCGHILSTNYPNPALITQITPTLSNTGENNHSDSHTWKDVTASLTQRELILQ